LDLNYIQSTQAVKLTQNSASIGCVVKTPSYAATFRMMGALSASGRNTSIGRINAPASYAFINTLDGSVINTNVVTTGNVFIEGVKNNTTQTNPIINGVGALAAQNSNATIVNVSALELTINNAGTPFSGYDTNYHLCSWHGSSALDNAALRTILNNLFTALGV
jgi:hypothetical protein